MLKRIIPLALLLLVPWFARTDEVTESAKKPPAVVVRLASLDTLREQLKLVGGLMGNENFGKQFDEAIKSKLGPKGLKGIDGKRPIGLYVHLGADLSNMDGVLMVPITSAKHFKETLEGLGWEIKTDKTGLHSVKQNQLPLDLQYRIVQEYAYVGLFGANALSPSGLLTPEAIFGAKPSSAAISMTVRLSQVPEGLRGMFLEAFKGGLGKIDDKKAAQTPAQKKLQVALAKQVEGMLQSLLKDGEELNAQIDIDPKTKQLAVDLTLNGKPHSKLAEKIAQLGERKTLFAGVLDKDAALNGLVNFDVPPEVRKALNGVVQEAIDKVLADMTDSDKKKHAEDLVTALLPSLTADDLDAAVSMRGPNKNKTFTLVAGFKLKQGDKLAATVIALIKTLPQGELKAIEFDADKAGEVAIHRIALQGALDAKTKEMFGDHPLFVAFRDDALFLAVGEDGLAAIKQAVTTPATAAPPLQFTMSLARFAAAAEKFEATTKTAEALLQAGDDARMRISLEGGPALRVRFTMALSAFKMFAGGSEK